MFLPLKDNLRSANFPLITAGLIAVNCLVYFLATSGGASLEVGAVRYGIIPYELSHSGVQCVPVHSFSDMYCGTAAQIHQMYPSLSLPATLLTIFTSMFMHASLEHLLGNMLYLFVFGRALETALGRGMYLVVYLCCGVIALAGQTLWDVNSMVPMVGASGAISGVMAGYLILFPGARVFSLFIIIPCRPRAFWVIGTWIALQLLLAWEVAGVGPEGGGVAVFAHLAGFAGGAALTYAVVGADRSAQFRAMARAADVPEPPKPVLPGQPVFMSQGQMVYAQAGYPPGQYAQPQFMQPGHAPPQYAPPQYVPQQQYAHPAHTPQQYPPGQPPFPQQPYAQQPAQSQEQSSVPRPPGC
ncbi:MAG: rhomboid family intramembrane serine protease [Solirubrobacterales bacterium]